MTFKIRSTSSLTGWRADKLRQRCSRILGLYQPILANQLQEEIARPQFVWPGTTRRKVGLYSGRTAGIQRDIVDTGRFAASQNDFRPDPLRLLYTWGGFDGAVTYAGIILRGKGQKYPGRDWIRPAIAAQPLDRFFLANWNRAATPVPSVIR